MGPAETQGKGKYPLFLGRFRKKKVIAKVCTHGDGKDYFQRLSRPIAMTVPMWLLIEIWTYTQVDRKFYIP